ncbi:hypothetical protein ACFVHB_10605 [Kitasatospora sp. NPDC127111]|uniref:hypothetical protein n=1 Tax=Kitasatospora sp. NPDC127111 TaxID=3345363 RepID=UPI0036349F71
MRRPAARAARTVRDAREWAGWLIAAAGAALCVLGWYGVSGESFAEQQIPYLASSTIPGAALIVAGVVLVALRPSDRTRGPTGPSEEADLTSRRVERLYALLVEPEEHGRVGNGPGGNGPDESGPGGNGPPESGPGGNGPDESGPGERAADRTGPGGTRAAPGRTGAADVGADDEPAGASGPLAVPGGTLYHRPDCPLVTGKPDARPVDAATVRARGLTACRLCEPGPPPGPPPAPPADAEGPAAPPSTRPGDTAPPAD